MVRVEALPMGIDYESYHQASENKEYMAIERTGNFSASVKLILSVDRLDYSKGMLHRLRGFATFLEHHAEYHGKLLHGNGHCPFTRPWRLCGTKNEV